MYASTKTARRGQPEDGHCIDQYRQRTSPAEGVKAKTNTPHPGAWDEIDDAVATFAEHLRERRRGGFMRTRLAEQTGIDISTLKRLEQHQAPTLVQLLRISHALQVTPWEMLGTVRYSDPRRELLDFSARSGHWRLVAPDFDASNPIEQTLSPGSRDTRVRHDGTEWLYVVEGRIALYLGRGDAPIKLAPRSVIEFDAAIPHSLGNQSDAPAVVLRRASSDGLQRHLPEAFEGD